MSRTGSTPGPKAASSPLHPPAPACTEHTPSSLGCVRLGCVSPGLTFPKPRPSTCLPLGLHPRLPAARPISTLPSWEQAVLSPTSPLAARTPPGVLPSLHRWSRKPQLPPHPLGWPRVPSWPVLRIWCSVVRSAMRLSGFFRARLTALGLVGVKDVERESPRIYSLSERLGGPSQIHTLPEPGDGVGSGLAAQEGFLQEGAVQGQPGPPPVRPLTHPGGWDRRSLGAAPSLGVLAVHPGLRQELQRIN